MSCPHLPATPAGPRPPGSVEATRLATFNPVSTPQSGWALHTGRAPLPMTGGVRLLAALRAMPRFLHPHVLTLLPASVTSLTQGLCAVSPRVTLSIGSWVPHHFRLSVASAERSSLIALEGPPLSHLELAALSHKPQATH